jgi:hypothetical protein
MRLAPLGCPSVQGKFRAWCESLLVCAQSQSKNHFSRLAERWKLCPPMRVKSRWILQYSRNECMRELKVTKYLLKFFKEVNIYVKVPKSKWISTYEPLSDWHHRQLESQGVRHSSHPRSRPRITGLAPLLTLSLRPLFPLPAMGIPYLGDPFSFACDWNSQELHIL